jgi:hypothetical protein
MKNCPYKLIVFLLLLLQCGRLPIQIAASLGKRSLVEILFPFTSPISAVENWSVQGIIAHEKSRCSIPKV